MPSYIAHTARGYTRRVVQEHDFPALDHLLQGSQPHVAVPSSRHTRAPPGLFALYFRRIGPHQADERRNPKLDLANPLAVLGPLAKLEGMLAAGTPRGRY